MKKLPFGLFVVLALSLVIFSSGCTVPGLGIEIPGIPDIFDIFGGGMNVQEQRHDIISIESLDAIPSTTVRSGQNIRLRAKIKNLQEPEYNPVEVEVGLFNSCEMFDIKADDMVCSTGEKPEKDSDGVYKCVIKRMYPQATALVEWKLTARDINVETPCKVGVMARYKYKTFSSASVTFVNRNELDRLVNEGKSFSETGTLVVGEGPVKTYIEVLDQPIVIDPQGSNLNAIGSGIMSLWIENRGGGILDIKSAKDGNVDFSCAAASDTKGPQPICINITSSPNTAQANSENIMAILGGNKASIMECIKERLNSTNSLGVPISSVSFIGKETPKYSCSITPNDASRIKQESTYQIMADVSYYYKFTKELSITVQPTVKL